MPKYIAIIWSILISSTVIILVFTSLKPKEIYNIQEPEYNLPNTHSIVTPKPNKQSIQEIIAYDIFKFPKKISTPEPTASISISNQDNSNPNQTSPSDLDKTTDEELYTPTPTAIPNYPTDQPIATDPPIVPTSAPTPVPTSTPTSETSPQPTNNVTVLGDANGDGQVNNTDYLNHWLPNYLTNNSCGLNCGDFNEDGKTDEKDYIIWLTNYTG